MTQFAIVEAGETSVRLRHIEEGHEYEFGCSRPNADESFKPQLIFHTEGGGCTGTGWAGRSLEQARDFAASIHQGVGKA